jgi:hypothetical protein
VTGVDPAGHRRQSDRDRRGPGQVGAQPGQPDRRHQARGQGGHPVRVHVVELDEQHRLPGRGRHPQPYRRRAHDLHRRGQRCGLEPGVLSGQVGDHAVDERGQPLGRRQRGECGRLPARRVDHHLRCARDLDRQPALAAQSRVRVRGEPGRGDAPVHGAEAGDPRPGELPRRPRGGAGDVVVQPSGGQVAQPLPFGRRSRPAVVAAGEPRHPYRGTGGGDPGRVGVRMRQREQAVGRSLDEQGRGADPVEHTGGAGLPQPGHGGRVAAAGLGHPPVRLAQVGGEPAARHRGRPVGTCPVDGCLVGGRPVAGRGSGRRPARRGRVGTRRPGQRARPGRRGAEEQRRPGPLEHAVGGGASAGFGQERIGQVVPGGHGHDGVHPVVVRGEQQRQRSAVRAAHHPHARVTGAVGADLRPPGQPVQQQARVPHLVVGVVEVDPPAARAEPAGGPGEDRVPASGQLGGVRRDRVLGAAVPVGEQHRRHRLPGGRAVRQVEGGVQLDPCSVILGTDRYHLRHGRVAGPVGPGHPGRNARQHDGRSDDGQPPPPHRAG